MKYIIFFILLFIAGCNETQPSLEFVAVQHVGKGVIDGDACKTLYRKDGHAVTVPSNFKITPFEAIEIAKDKLNYSCSNKLGVQIFSDGKSYHIVRLGLTEDAIVINGTNGAMESIGFMK